MNLYKVGELDAVYNHAVPNPWLDIIKRRRTTWTGGGGDRLPDHQHHQASIE
jgi:hypothetical protein